jgi:hypothetical protein
MVARVALDGDAQNAAGFVFRPGSGFLENPPGQIGGIAEGFVFRVLEDQGTGLGIREMGDALEFRMFPLD